MPPSSICTEFSIALTYTSRGVRPLVSAWLSHMNAGWLALSCVPAESAPGVWVCALTKPGTARKRLPSMRFEAFGFATSPIPVMV